MIRLGLVGARGHVGTELIKLLASHPGFDIAFVSSRERDGQRLADHEPAYQGELRYTALDAAGVAASGVDAVVLGLPNGLAAPYVAAIDSIAPGMAIVDLSADFRFDATWTYGLPERNRAALAGATRISNPGCYATAMQLALAPVLDLVDGPAQCFGVSGYSGAGTTPSDKNDPAKLHDNLMPYSLVNHVHEREVTRHLGHPVEFMPHVAPHFRGITMTVNVHLNDPATLGALRARYATAYASEPLVRVVDGAPWVSRIANRHGVEIGGFALSDDGRRLVVVSTLDNLLKGAATQALQNLNLAFGQAETTGLTVEWAA
ncbi:N-acetyl-gamma-glutamyl-phosphate reductase [Silanimonas sp.]|jgi:N-acetyl-gamma-glutamyl-phosphate reductase common form|uniref:N-acetyl-gamma-glutamyl-phosphate reductase n=1 Tax=Silanimonas sp. TaxID=1929290 RepID=UPI0022BCEC07|nr:N-acetyl-gamma-glutamyl-phosphate reductase [Silanimonas sp.]MCZ8063769.1 N-acetyl-gamma-glutamyl-phosphate reductase [Silanimonas sp.]